MGVYILSFRLTAGIALVGVVVLTALMAQLGRPGVRGCGLGKARQLGQHQQRGLGRAALFQSGGAKTNDE